MRQGSKSYEAPTMYLLLLMNTQPQSQSYIEHYLSESLLEVNWRLTSKSEDGRSWLITLISTPCSEFIENALNTLAITEWVVAMKFSHLSE